MNRKQVTILGRKFSVRGDPQDKYFREFVKHGSDFRDVPIVIAWRYCSSDAVCIDVGANIGLSTLAFAGTAPNGRVLAFEASPRAFKFLEQNVRDNGFANVECIQCALSNREGTLRFYEDPEFLAGSRIQDVASDPHRPSLEVASRTLDSELSKRDLQRLDILKVDVEGYEQEVLEGAVETIKRFRPLCVIEFNSYALAYERHIAPWTLMAHLESIFPKIYHFDRKTFALNDVTGRSDEFLEINDKTGFVNDLVCTFSDLPDPIR